MGLARVCGSLPPGFLSSSVLVCFSSARAPTAVLAPGLGPDLPWEGGKGPTSRGCTVSPGLLPVCECASSLMTLCVQKAGIYRGRECGSGCQGLRGSGRR